MRKSILLLVSLLALSTNAAAAIWYVDKDNTGAEDGTAWGTAYTTIQPAIDAAYDDSGGEVWAAEGVYDEQRDNDTGSVIMRESVHVYGGFAGDETARGERDSETHITTIDGSTARAGQPAYHVVVGADNSTLDGFTISGGNAAGTRHGGGMYNDGSSPTVTKCTFTGNSAGWNGGGMYNCSSSSPTVTNCTFTGNSAEGGGGMGNYQSSPTVTDCTFADNWADENGGGMSNVQSSPTVTNCTFTDNAAYHQGGGGMYNYHSSSPTVRNCTFTRNSAGDEGGGMYNDYYSSPTVTNCMFAHNSTFYQYGGGGMYNYYYSSPTVTNCTFVGNSVAWYGGGMYNGASSPTVTNCTFMGNSAGWYGGGMINYGSSPTVTNCTFMGNWASLGGGGGMYNGGSSPRVTDCTFMGNSADGYGGGGMYNLDSSSPMVTNCTFMCNWTDCSGGGMRNDSSSPTVTNCTFMGNSAYYYGGGMFNLDSSSPTVTNCILWGDSPNEIYNYDSSYPTITYSDIEGGCEGEGNIAAFPYFVNATSGDLRLFDVSPCIDAGTATGAPETDIRGVTRPQGAGVDMGAYEMQPGECLYDGLFNDPDTGEGPAFAASASSLFPDLADLLVDLGWYYWEDFDMEHLEEVIGGEREEPGDGVPDAFQLALVENALCQYSYIWDQECIVNAFLSNKAAFAQDVQALIQVDPDLAALSEFNNLFAALLGTSTVMQNTIDALVLQRTGGVSGLPHLDEYLIFGVGCGGPSKDVDEPFSAPGDFDRDGLSNLEEYNQVLAAGGDIDTFVAAASDPSPFWPGNPALPVAGLAGLGVLAAAFVVGGAFAVRKR